MQGFPPPENRRATLANWRQAPFSRWAVHHVRDLVPTAAIPHDPADIWPLRRGDAALPAADLAAAIDGMATDAVVILHQGRLVHESYRDGMTASDPHIGFSVSKYILGLVAGVLEARGILDVSAPVSIPSGAPMSRGASGGFERLWTVRVFRAPDEGGNHGP